MIRKFLCLSALVVLGGCYDRQQEPAPQPQQHRPRPRPDLPPPWLASEPVCSGSITRAEWLVCDNRTLNDLHRRLARQWDEDRQYASSERLRVLELQLRALLSERNECRDVPCIATAYRRYLGMQAPPPPAAKPIAVKPKWKPKPKPKPRPRYRPTREGGESGWYRGAGEQSCAAEIGPSAAQRLASQCSAVNRTRGGACSTRRTCDDLYSETEQGCWSSPTKPGFCRR